MTGYTFYSILIVRSYGISFVVTLKTQSVFSIISRVEI